MQSTDVLLHEEDAARRDFTINGLGLDIDGTIIDHVNGLEDLKDKKEYSYKWMKMQNMKQKQPDRYAIVLFLQ